jgi:hypothetical protein
MLRSDASVLSGVDESVVAQRHRIWTQSHFAFADKRTRFVVSGLWPSARVTVAAKPDTPLGGVVPCARIIG